MSEQTGQQALFDLSGKVALVTAFSQQLKSNTAS